MAFIIGLLTFVMVLDCLILVLLVLIQLPKKDAGAGLAFGGAATDALFGAGSGNVLTKTTKYAAVAFFVLTLMLALMQRQLYYRTSSKFIQELKQQTQQVPRTAPAPSPETPAPGATAPSPAAADSSTNLLLSLPAPTQPAAASTNTPLAPKK